MTFISTPEEALLHEVLTAHGFEAFAPYRALDGLAYYRRVLVIRDLPDGGEALARDLASTGFVVVPSAEIDAGTRLPSVAYVSVTPLIPTDWVLWRPR